MGDKHLQTLKRALPSILVYGLLAVFIFGLIILVEALLFVALGVAISVL